MRRSSFVAGACALVVATGIRGAKAQDGGFALDHFEPAPAGDAFFGVPSPYAAGHLAPAAYLAFDYAHWPIQLRTDTDDVAVVSSQAFLRLDASLALWERLLVTADLPLAVMIAGDDPGIAGVAFSSLEAPKLGDLRLGARVRIFGEDGGPFQLGAGGYFFAPTGSHRHYAGDGAVRGQFHALLGGRVGEDVGFAWTAAGGVELRASDTNAHALTYGAAAALMLGGDLVQLGPELYGQTAFGRDLSLASAPVQTTPAGTNAELLFGAKLRVLGGLTLGAAGGPGLGTAVGTPVFRVVGLVGWTPLPSATAEPLTEDTGKPEANKTKDRDNDGIPDDFDACPDTPGQPNPDPTKDGCPPPDRDGDGVLDAEDACPAVAGARNVDAAKNGCPEDRDGDGVADAADKCPDVPGVASDDPAKNGCPGDRDGDGLADHLDPCPDAKGAPDADPKKSGCPDDPDGDKIKWADDACPLEKGEASADPRKNGCPKAGSTGPAAPAAEPEVGEHVLFRVSKSTFEDIVNPPGDKLVRAIREALASAEVDHIEVQGHTDDSGEDRINDRVSVDRAETVREWLVRKGIPGDKLVAKGYSWSRPLADNRVRQGRQQNRRVQFVLIRRGK
jgi:OOP family OmpA-OmpF porin